MPKGYWIARVDVRDPEIYQQYVKANAAAFAKFGAASWCAAASMSSPRASAPARNVVIEFRDYETALACHEFAGISRAPQNCATPRRRWTSSSPKATTARSQAEL